MRLINLSIAVEFPSGDYLRVQYISSPVPGRYVLHVNGETKTFPTTNTVTLISNYLSTPKGDPYKDFTLVFVSD